MNPSYKENQTNRALLIRLFGKEWIKKRDKYFQDILDSRKTNTEQLKLF